MKANLLFLLAGISLLIACGGTDDPEPDCNTTDLAVQISSSQNTSCGGAEGEITATASGGAGDYEFSKDGSNFQASGTFSDLAADSYTITVRDGNDCTKTASVSILNEDGVNLETVAAASGCGTSEGSITLTATGGVEPYQYKLNNGAFGDNANFSGLQRGTYSVTTVDAEGCSVTQSVTVSSGISYEAEISPIITTNCAISGCHAGTQSPDFRQFSNIKENAALIKTKTGDGSMPKNGSLTADEIAKIACWVDDGALDN